MKIVMTTTTKVILFASLIAAMILPFSMMDVSAAPNENANDKSLVKEKIKDKMNKQSDKDKKAKNTNKKFTSDEYGIPYNLFFEHEGKLIVGIDGNKAKQFDKKYSKSNVKSDLNTDIDLEVRYFAFDRETLLKGGDGLVDPAAPTTSLATITVVKNNKIVTTGHDYDQNDLIASEPNWGGTVCKEVKITKDNNWSGAYADAAYGVDMNNGNNCNNTYENNKIRYNGNSYSVTYGTASDIVLNKPIIMEGMVTTGTSWILDTDATVKFPDGVLNDQAISAYASAGGDSGAPVFELTGSSSAKLLGQHVGRACEIDLNSGTNYGWWCDANGNGGLKVFSPWDQVASHLGI